MSKQTGIVVAVLAVVAIAAGTITYVVMAGSAADSEASNTTTQQDPVSTTPAPNDAALPGGDEAPERATVEVAFTDSGFDKATYTLKAGEVLLVKNNSSETLQLASDDHPTHTLNGELNAPAVAPGETTRLTPTTPGTYGIHDHIRSQFTAMVEVTQ